MRTGFCAHMGAVIDPPAPVGFGSLQGREGGPSRGDRATRAVVRVWVSAEQRVSVSRLVFRLCGQYVQAADQRSPKAMAKASMTGFQRIVHRARPDPVESTLRVTRCRHSWRPARSGNDCKPGQHAGRAFNDSIAFVEHITRRIPTS
ncbi:hypothetical protein JCM9534A_63640 [Catenuloplanes indicus JCM 9534]